MTSVTRIDLNCDMGELPELLDNGTQLALMRSVTSVNVACGAHAGDERLMRATIAQAQSAGVALGAHPGYQDRQHFGRRELNLSAEAIADLVHGQVAKLAQLAAEGGAMISFVKPHGALYNQAVADRAIAGAIAEGVARWRRDVTLVGLAGPAGALMLETFRGAGFTVAAEAFADRRYEASGRLRSRQLAESLLNDPAQAAAQSLRIAGGQGVVAADGTHVPMRAQTLCVHSDTPGSVRIAEAVRTALAEHQVTVVSLLR